MVVCVGSAGHQLLPALADPTLVLLKGVHFDVEHQLYLNLRLTHSNISKCNPGRRKNRGHIAPSCQAFNSS